MLLDAAIIAAAPQTIKPGEIWRDDRGQYIQARGGAIIQAPRHLLLNRRRSWAGARSRQALRELLFLEGPCALDLPPSGAAAGRSRRSRCALRPREPQSLLQREDQEVRDVHAHRRCALCAGPRWRRHLRHRRWRLQVPPQLLAARPQEPRHLPIHRRRRNRLPDF